MRERDVVVVGAGVGGSALASALAAAGLDVLALERTEVFEDRVRGEWMAPWGVAEVQALGLDGVLRAAGAHFPKRHIGYDELAEPAAAEARTLPLDVALPGVPGPLCLEHVRIQDALVAHARSCGAEVLRGVATVETSPGPRPAVRWTTADGAAHEVACRLLVGADGRASAVRRRLGIELEEAAFDTLIGGLLVRDADAWPEDAQATGKIGDIHYLVFPQGRGQVRLYAVYDARARGRFSGPDGARRFLAAFASDRVPASGVLAGASPAGPCRSYPCQDGWTDCPFAQGAVLVGDAAGYNDPIIGQGLSITLRDVRMVRDALLGAGAWSAAIFEGYAEERRERLRRLRFAARFIQRLHAGFEGAALARRLHALGVLEREPALGLPVLQAVFAGPETVAPEWFTPAYMERVFGPGADAA